MTSSSTSRDSIGNTRKTASGNYCETLNAIEQSDQMLSPFSPVIPVWIYKASSSTSWDSIGTTRKTASGNYCKTLSAIQRSDQNLRPFSAFIPVWRDMTSTSTSRDSIGIQGKRPPETTVKLGTRSNGRIKKYGHFYFLFRSGATWHPLQRVGIP